MIPTAIRRSLLRPVLAGFCLLPVQSAFAETPNQEKTELDPLIVSALRVPREASTVTSSVTSLDPEQLETSGILQLRDALNAAPGVISTSTGGQTGAASSLFIRGARTAESLVLIDGLRINGSGNQLGNLFSASRTYDVGIIEVLRGPQGAIYGGESIGGVLWMETPRGDGDPSGAVTIEAGSFNSFASHGKFQGSQDNRFSYYLSGGYEETDNDGPSQHFHQGNTALRVEGGLDSVWTIGTTFRAVDSFYDDRGTSDNRFDAALGTLYAIGRISDCWTTRFITGGYQEFYDNESADGTYSSDLRARSFSIDNEITLAENLRLLAGGFFQHDEYKSIYDYPSDNPLYSFYSSANEDADRYGIHSVLEWDVLEELTTTAALRWEDYDSHGKELTWRLGSIYHIEQTGTSLRSGFGTAFRAPSYMDLYYKNNFGAMGNPDLDPQSSKGWEIGIDQKIGDRHIIEVTGFRNLIDEAIDSYAFPSPMNVPGKTTTDGVEIGVRGHWLENIINYRVAWTWLHESLSDQPRNAATASLDWKATEKSLIGLGATHLASHSWGGDPIDAYTVARIYGSYQVAEKVKFHARVENVLNEDYELYGGNSAFGAPLIKGAGAGVYAGVTIDW
jgi:outer membrane cobalamin receptor